jgi:hypothetical protein
MGEGGMGRVPEGLFESDGTWWKEEGPGNVGGLGIGLKEVRKTRGWEWGKRKSWQPLLEAGGFSLFLLLCKENANKPVLAAYCLSFLPPPLGHVGWCCLLYVCLNASVPVLFLNSHRFLWVEEAEKESKNWEKDGSRWGVRAFSEF